MASFIAGGTGNQAGVAAITLSATLNVSVGDLIVAGVGAGTNVTAIVMTDSQGGGLNTYNAHPNNVFQINSPGKRMWSFYSIIASGSATMQFTATATGGNSGMGINVTQYRGYLASPLDATGVAADSGVATTHNLGSLSTNGSNDTIVGVNIEIPVSAQTFTPGAGWTMGAQNTATTGCPTFTQYQLGQAVGPFTDTYTTAVSTQDGGFIWAFKETGWAPAVTVPPSWIYHRKNVLYFI